MKFMTLKDIILDQQNCSKNASSKESIAKNKQAFVAALQDLSNLPEINVKELIEHIEKNDLATNKEEIDTLHQFANFYKNEIQKNLFLFIKNSSSRQVLTKEDFEELAKILKIELDNDSLQKNVYKKYSLHCHPDKTKNIPVFYADLFENFFKKLSNSIEQDEQAKEIKEKHDFSISLEIKKRLEKQWMDELDGKIEKFDINKKSLDWMKLTEEEKILYEKRNQEQAYPYKVNSTLYNVFKNKLTTLLKNNLDIDFTDYNEIDCNAFEWINEYKHKDDASFLLCWAAAAGRLNYIKALLNKKVDINTWSNVKFPGKTIKSHTPLFWALFFRQYQAVDLLLLRGANTDLLDGYGNNILFFAANALTFKQLIRHLIVRKEDYTQALVNLISKKNPNGESYFSALMRSSSGGHFNLIPQDRWQVIEYIAPFVPPDMVFQNEPNSAIFKAIGSSMELSKLYLLKEILYRSDMTTEISNTQLAISGTDTKLGTDAVNTTNQQLVISSNSEMTNPQLALTQNTTTNQITLSNIKILPKDYGITPLAIALAKGRIGAAKLLILYKVESPNDVDSELRLNAFEAAVGRICSTTFNCFNKESLPDIISFIQSILSQYDDSFQINYWTQFVSNLSFSKFSFLNKSIYNDFMSHLENSLKKEMYDLIKKTTDHIPTTLEKSYKLLYLLHTVKEENSYPSFFSNFQNFFEIKSSIIEFLALWGSIFGNMTNNKQIEMPSTSNDKEIMVLDELFYNAFLFHLNGLKRIYPKSGVINVIIEEIKSLNKSTSFLISLAKSSLIPKLAFKSITHQKTDSLINDLKNHKTICQTESQKKIKLVNFFEGIIGNSSQNKIDVIDKLLVYFSAIKKACVSEDILIKLIQDNQFPMNIGFTDKEKDLINDGRLGNLLAQFKQISNSQHPTLKLTYE